jgi:hypothetical protein
MKRSIQQAKKNGVTFVVKLADTGTSSSRIQPVYEGGNTQLVALEDSVACSIEYSLESRGGCAGKRCQQYVCAIATTGRRTVLANYFVRNFLIPYPQIVGELEEECTS